MLCFSYKIIAYDQAERNLADYHMRMGLFGLPHKEE